MTSPRRAIRWSPATCRTVGDAVETSINLLNDWHLAPVREIPAPLASDFFLAQADALPWSRAQIPVMPKAFTR